MLLSCSVLLYTHPALSLFLISITFSFFFFNDTATTEIYTLSLHDALPIFHLIRRNLRLGLYQEHSRSAYHWRSHAGSAQDRKSTRLNSSHANISYAVFCLKKKKKRQTTLPSPPSMTPAPSSTPTTQLPQD